MSAIHEAIHKVMDEVGYVKKSRAQNLNYSFAGEAALISALRPSMVEHGLYMTVSKIHTITRENYTTKNGTAMVNTVIHASVRFTHVSGESFEVDAVGEGSDSGDKSANKAMTGLYKYALRQTFCIETGDDPDKTASEERKPAGKVAPEKPAAAKVSNEIITDSEWEKLTQKVDFLKSKNVSVPGYDREKMKASDFGGVLKFLDQKIAQVNK